MKYNWFGTYKDNEENLWMISECQKNIYCRKKGSKEIHKKICPESDKRYINIIPNGKELILISDKLDNVEIVNKNTLERRYINIPRRNILKVRNGLPFLNGVVYKQYLYLFGHAYPGIVKVDLLTEEVSVVDEWTKYIKPSNEDDGFFHMKYVITDGKIYYPFLNCNAVLKYDLCSDEVSIITVGEEKDRYTSIEFDGSYFWLIPRDRTEAGIIRWSSDTNEVVAYRDYPKDYDCVRYSFFRTLFHDGKVYLFAHLNSSNICIDTKTGGMSTFPHIYDISDVKGCKYQNMMLNESEIVFYTDAEYIIWDLTNNQVRTDKLVLNDDIRIEYENKNMKRNLDKANGLLRENQANTLGRYLQYLIEN